MLYKEAAYYHDVLENRDYIDYNVDYQIMKAVKENGNVNVLNG